MLEDTALEDAALEETVLEDAAPDGNGLGPATAAPAARTLEELSSAALAAAPASELAGALAAASHTALTTSPAPALAAAATAAPTTSSTSRAPAARAAAPASAPAAAPAPGTEGPLRDLAAAHWAALDEVNLLEEFALDCPTLRSVPKTARKAAADACEALCRAVLRAPEGTAEEERAWKLLFLRERLLFLAPLNLGKKHDSATADARLDLGRLVRERAGALLRGEWAPLLEQTRATARRLARQRAAGNATELNENHLADAVCRKVFAGECSRAAALLASPGLAPVTEETAGMLQELLQPRAAPALAQPPRPDGAAPPLFSRKETKQTLRSCPRGSSAAVGGARFEHLHALLGSPGAVDAFHEVLVRVSAGRVPEHAAEALAVARLMPLRKPNGGVRPIAAPSLLRRLAGRILVRKRKAELAEALGPQQYAVGTAAGTELMAHTVRALTEADPELTVLALDARNANCTASREACLEQLAAKAPDLLPCARLFTQRESHYFFWDGRGHCHELRTTNGVDQGDPLAPLLFACGLAPAWKPSRPTSRSSLAPAASRRAASGSSRTWTTWCSLHRPVLQPRRSRRPSALSAASAWNSTSARRRLGARGQLARAS